MRLRNTFTVTDDSRISFFTCSSGSAWKLAVGPNPFGAYGGTRGTFRPSKHPWINAIDVAGSGKGDRALVQFALKIAEQIASRTSGAGFAYGLQVVRELKDVLRMDTSTREAKKLFARAVDLLAEKWGREYVAEHGKYKKPRKQYERRQKPSSLAVSTVVVEPVVEAEPVSMPVEEPVAVMEEVRIVTVATVMSDGSVIPSLQDHDCI